MSSTTPTRPSITVSPTTGPIDLEWVDGNPAIPLPETIEYMQEYRWNFVPALEMVAEEYDVEDLTSSPA